MKEQFGKNAIQIPNTIVNELSGYKTNIKKLKRTVHKTYMYIKTKQH